MNFLKKLILILFCLTMVTFVGCESRNQDLPEDKVDIIDEGLSDEEVSEEEEDVIEEETIDPKESIDLSLKPNEAGEIMILMYHNIGEEEGEWTRTPENFKKDLTTLYEKGYRPVSLKDYVNNNMDVEAGMTPVVITFDDGNENNFRIIEGENGELAIDPNSAVGILEDFGKEHPDFVPKATFFIFGSNPFRQEEYVEYKLNYLIENGYDVGNHTIDHRSMRSIKDKEEIQEAIARQVSIINDILPDYPVDTYALCYGERPKDKELEKYLEEGEFQGTSYKKIAILNVGWNPAPSSISKDFNPLSLPRIRASEMKVDNVGIYNWLEYFDNNPSKRYISDGVKEVITLPKDLEDTIDMEKIQEKELYLYDN